MAVKRPRRKSPKVKAQSQVVEVENAVSQPKWHDAVEEGGEALDPGEEKMLDWILKGVVIFVLGWLALGVLMAVGGLFGIWK